MAIQLDDIQQTFLAFLVANPGGGTRPQVISALVSGGATSGQAGGALNAIQQAAMDIGATDAATYNAFMTRFAALSGNGRGLIMAEAACDYARERYLVTADLDAKILNLQETLSGFIPQQLGFVASARSAVSGAGFTNAVTQTLFRVLDLGEARVFATSGALQRSIQDLIEQRG